MSREALKAGSEAALKLAEEWLEMDSLYDTSWREHCHNEARKATERAQFYLRMAE